MPFESVLIRFLVMDDSSFFSWSGAGVTTAVSLAAGALLGGEFAAG